MRAKALLVSSAVIALIVGLVFIALRNTAMGIAGAMGAGLIAQILGANFIGFAVLNFFSRNLPDGDGLRAVLLANFTSNVLGLLITLGYWLTSGLNIYGWIVAAIYLILTLAFGYTLVARPREIMASAATNVPCPQEPC